MDAMTTPGAPIANPSETTTTCLRCGAEEPKDPTAPPWLTIRYGCLACPPIDDPVAEEERRRAGRIRQLREARPW